VVQETLERAKRAVVGSPASSCVGRCRSRTHLRRDRVLALGRGLVFERERRPRAAQVVDEVGGEHADECVGLHALSKAVADGADLKCSGSGRGWVRRLRLAYAKLSVSVGTFTLVPEWVDRLKLRLMQIFAPHGKEPRFFRQPLGRSPQQGARIPGNLQPDTESPARRAPAMSTS